MAQTQMVSEKRLFKGGKYRYLLIAILCITLIMAVSLLMLFLGDRKDSEANQAENYTLLAQNVEKFEALYERASTVTANMVSALERISTFADGTPEENDTLFPEHIAESGIQWIRDYESMEATDGRHLYNRISIVLASADDFDKCILYAPKSGYSFGTINNGDYFFLARNEKELRRVFDTDVRWQTAQSGSLVFIPGVTEEDHQQLYVVQRLTNGIIMLLGFSDQALSESLFANRKLRSYKLEQIAVHLPNGGLAYLYEQKKVSFVGRTWDVLTNRSDVFESNTYLMMRYTSSSPYYTLVAIMSPTGTGSVMTATLFMPFVAINVLWALLVSFICVYVLKNFNRPIDEIFRELGLLQDSNRLLSETEQLSLIESTIQKYHQDMKSGQEHVEEQRNQIRRIYLGKLALDQNTYLSDQQLETLHIPQLLKKYMLIVLYPENGRWTRAVERSEQELAYQRQIAIMSAQEAMRTNLMIDGAEYLTCHTRVLIVVPIGESVEADAVREKALASAQSISMNLGFRLLIGFSKVYDDQSRFSHAYREALRKVVPAENDLPQEAPELNFSEMLKKSTQISNLIYIEHYDGAYEAFAEIVHAIFQQPSGGMRTQQLQSFQTLMLCMLNATNETNVKLLDQLDLEVDRPQISENEEMMLAQWRTVFKKLEENKEHKKISQYTEQFAAVYQYMLLHYHDPDISLSMLSSEFGMTLPTLSREFQKNLGKGFLETLHQMRIEEARAEIENTELSLNQIAEAVGYTNVLTMTRAFKKYYGATPGSFRGNS